jgi:NADP-reducing hydrogenase subunit HndB
MIRTDFLQSTDVFQGLREDELAKILPVLQIEAYPENERLFAENEAAGHVWVVMEGQVDLRFELPGRPTSIENTISTTPAGQTLGWSSLVPPYRYKLSAYCASRTCRILRIEKEALERICRRNPRIGYVITTNLASVASHHLHRLMSSSDTPAPVPVKVIVHMGTCGIAAGARNVMVALMEELSDSGRSDVQAESAGCIGLCEKEPVVTVVIGGQEPVVYQRMTADKMRRVFRRHIQGGTIQTELTAG